MEDASQLHSNEGKLDISWNYPPKILTYARVVVGILKMLIICSWDVLFYGSILAYIHEGEKNTRREVELC